jgi:dCMP deaminase
MLHNTPASDWDNIFFLEATLWSRRSHDTQTQCGCVLVKDKTPLSEGYNGFIRDIDDTVLPRVRPSKYPFMIHAEANAIYNCARQGRSTLGSTAYITALPCCTCLQMLYQCGVKEIVFSDISNPKMSIWNSDYDKILELIGEKIHFRYVPRQNLDPNLLLEANAEIAKK